MKGPLSLLTITRPEGGCIVLELPLNDALERIRAISDAADADGRATSILPGDWGSRGLGVAQLSVESDGWRGIVETVDSRSDRPTGAPEPIEAELRKRYVPPCPSVARELSELRAGNQRMADLLIELTRENMRLQAEVLRRDDSAVDDAAPYWLPVLGRDIGSEVES